MVDEDAGTRVHSGAHGNLFLDEEVEVSDNVVDLHDGNHRAHNLLSSSRTPAAAHILLRILDLLPLLQMLMIGARKVARETRDL